MKDKLFIFPIRRIAHVNDILYSQFTATQQKRNQISNWALTKNITRESTDYLYIILIILSRQLHK